MSTVLHAAHEAKTIRCRDCGSVIRKRRKDWSSRCLACDLVRELREAVQRVASSNDPRTIEAALDGVELALEGLTVWGPGHEGRIWPAPSAVRRVKDPILVGADGDDD